MPRFTVSPPSLVWQARVAARTGPTASRASTIRAGLLWTVLETCTWAKQSIKPFAGSHSGDAQWVTTTIVGLAGTWGSDDGTNDTVRFEGVNGVAVDTAGNLYVADYLNCTIRKLTREGTNFVSSTLAGLAGSNGSDDGTNGEARFEGPVGRLTVRKAKR